MPFYEYECSSCKFYTEVMQKISDTPLTKCPSCGKSALVKLVSAPNFRLKGGGWYETDFKGDKEDKRNLAGADRDEPSSSEAAAKPESKTEAKAESASSESKPAPASVSTSASSTGGAKSKPAIKAPPGKAGAGRASTGQKAPPGKAKVAAKGGKLVRARSKAKPAAKKKARR